MEDFFLMPTFNCYFNRHTSGLHYWFRMLVLNVFAVVTIFIFISNDWHECVGECAQHHNIFLVHLSLGNIAVVYVDPYGKGGNFRKLLCM